jgi:hypothetical protein
MSPRLGGKEGRDGSQWQETGQQGRLFLHQDEVQSAMALSGWPTVATTR